MDLTSQIIAYENGELENDEMLALFAGLVNTGLAWQLQGHYGRTAKSLIDAGYLVQQGGKWTVAEPSDK